MPRYFVEFSYDGSNYHGLQKQPNLLTIQETIEINMNKYLGINSNLTLAGRTDTGVHAKQMFAHFDIDLEFQQDNFCRSMNKMLPKDITIESLSLVTNESHARFDASSRTYEYFVNSKKNPFNYKFSYYLKHHIDIKKMNKSCTRLINHLDFKCFSKSNTDVKTYNCDISYAKWDVIDEGIRFKITANRFLRNMVRSIVGTMIDIGSSKISDTDFQKILDSRNRSEAGLSVPSAGLFLTNITYPQKFIKTWKK
ncbi:MAG: tRNA pseudouridine(38-40) synthase TruA [Flavobacteriaceae bacterium]|nr:tRNA pseudouridine(38-40) synthase TruA [Flavobacteriaceae bacterium]